MNSGHYWNDFPINRLILVTRIDQKRCLYWVRVFYGLIFILFVICLDQLL